MDTKTSVQTHRRRDNVTLSKPLAIQSLVFTRRERVGTCRSNYGPPPDIPMVALDLCLPHCAPCHRGGHRCTSGSTPPTGQHSAIKGGRAPMGANGTGPVQSNVLVKTVQKRRRRQQAPSANIQRRRKLIAATERSRNQADRQQQKKRASSRSCRAEGLRAPAASGVFSAAVQTDISEDAPLDWLAT